MESRPRKLWSNLADKSGSGLSMGNTTLYFVVVAGLYRTRSVLSSVWLAIAHGSTTRSKFAKLIQLYSPPRSSFDVRGQPGAAALVNRIGQALADADDPVGSGSGQGQVARSARQGGREPQQPPSESVTICTFIHVDGAWGSGPP
jgi:hypothetical protein